MINQIQRLEETVSMIQGAYAPSTIKAYRRDFLQFIEFCTLEGYQALPAPKEAVVEFIDHMKTAKRTAGAIVRKIAGISCIHWLNEVPDPTKAIAVKLAVKKLYRTVGRYQRQVEGVTRDILEEMLKVTDDSLHGIRDRALLLVAYDTLCRRSEVASLLAEDISRKVVDRKTKKTNTVILLRKSKTDQEAHGRWLAISDRANEALVAWLEASGIKSGPIFRGIRKGGSLTKDIYPGHISRTYKLLAKRANLEKELVENISGHSMRVGAAQDLVLSGASLPIIMCKGRWTKPDTVMRYVEKLIVPI